MNKVGHPYLLKIFSTILHHLSNSIKLNNMSQILLHFFEKKQVSLIDKHLLDQMSLIICGKISISVNYKVELKENVLILMDYMVENEMINCIFEKFIHDQITEIKKKKKWKGFSKEDEKKFIQPLPKPLNLLESALKQNLLFLLDLKPKAIEYFKENFGNSLLDFEGNFLWADKRTCNILDLKKPQFASEDSKVNLFNLMIPPSKRFLKKKLGGVIFKRENPFGTRRSMSYVIYSGNTLEKFKKSLVSKGVKDAKSYIAKQCKKSKEQLFINMLKSASSRVTLVGLSYSSKELQSLLDSEKCQFENSKYMFKFLQDSMKNGQRKQKFIFMETRLSGNIPGFDYRKLLNDKVILEYQTEIQKALDKNLKKKEKNKKKKKSTQNLINKSKSGEFSNVGLKNLIGKNGAHVPSFQPPLPPKGIIHPTVNIRSTEIHDHKTIPREQVASFGLPSAYEPTYMPRRSLNNGIMFRRTPQGIRQRPGKQDFHLLPDPLLSKRDGNLFTSNLNRNLSKQ